MEYGYLHTGWDVKDDTILEKNLEVTALYDREIINDPTKEDSNKYWKVTFEKGEHGQLKGNTVIGILKTSEKRVKDIEKPRVEVDEGYSFKGWDKEEEEKITKDTTITALYDLDIINDPKTEKPKEGYARVRFESDDKGSLKGKTIVDVKKGKVKIGQLTKPQVISTEGYSFKKWDKEDEMTITEDMTITAINVENIIYDPSYKEPEEGYVRITFDGGNFGKIGNPKVADIYIKAKVKVGEIRKPQVTADTGYKFTKWDRNEEYIIERAITITAKYEEESSSIPQLTKGVIFVIKGKEVPSDKETIDQFSLYFLVEIIKPLHIHK